MNRPENLSLRDKIEWIIKELRELKRGGGGSSSATQQALNNKLDKGTYTGNASDLKSLIDTKINGSGTTNSLSKFTSNGTIGNSIVYDNGTNVGIGTTTPSQKLSVNGNITLLGTQSTPQYIFANNSADNSGLVIKAGSTAGVYSQIEVLSNWNGTSNSGGKIAFHVGGTERLRINPDGKVGMGVTSPSEKLDVNGNVKATLIKDQYGTLRSQRVITVTGNITLSEIHNGAILHITNNCNITIPTGLGADFACNCYVKGAFIATFVNGGVTLNSPSGLLLKTDKMCTLYSNASNELNLLGELATS